MVCWWHLNLILGYHCSIGGVTGYDVGGSECRLGSWASRWLSSGRDNRHCMVMVENVYHGHPLGNKHYFALLSASTIELEE